MANRYWVGGTGGWSQTSHWSTTSGGSGGASVPTTNDNVYFDANSGVAGASYTVDYDTLFSARYCADLSISNPSAGTITFGTYTNSFGNEYLQYLYPSGNITISSGVTANFDLYPNKSSGTQTLSSNGATITSIVKYFHPSTLQFISNVQVNLMFLLDGVVDANNYNVTTEYISFDSGGTSTCVLNMGSGTWELTGDNPWSPSGLFGGTINAQTSTIKLTKSGSGLFQFTGHDQTYYNIWFAQPGSARGKLIGSNTFNNLKVNPGKELNLQNASINTVSTVNISGTDGNLVVISNSLGSTRATLNSSSGTSFSIQYCDISNITGTPSNKWYFDITCVDGGNNSGLIFPENPSIITQYIPKTYDIKVYTIADEYITTWTDVISSISFNNEINSAGGQLNLVLGRNAGDYGEGTDVNFGNIVKVYCIDSENPDGILVYQGSITGYTPIYKDDTVEVTILNVGETMSTSLLQTWVSSTNSVLKPAGITSYSFTAPSYTPFASFGGEKDVDTYWFLSGARLTVPAGMTSIGQIKFNYTSKDVRFGSTDYTMLYDITCTIYPKLTTGARSGFPDFNTPLGSKTLEAGNTYESEIAGPYSGFSSEVPKFYSFVFDSLIPVTAGTDYFIVFSSPDAPYQGISNPDYFGYYLNDWYWGTGKPASLVGYTNYVSNSGTYEGVGTTTTWPIEVWAGDGSTEVAYTNDDPGDILKDIIDKYRQQGGSLNYDLNSIQTTGTSVSYTFNTNTVLEAVNKVLELCPENWYWYIDYSTNLIHLREKSSSPDHLFSLERDLIDAKFEKRIEDIVNVIYFTGGETSPGVNFFKKYYNQASIDRYGIRAIKYSDTKVTTDATASAIANSILEVKSQPELRVTLEILDSNNEQGLGYDIESVEVGDVVAVRNITQSVGLSTWDVARWDEAYWDYNIYNLSSLQMQIQKIDYNEDKLTVYASTMAVDVNKRIEQINSQLEAIQTLNNPTSPT